MRLVLAQIHYQPDDWKGNAHTQRVRGEFAQLFEYKMVKRLSEPLSDCRNEFKNKTVQNCASAKTGSCP